MKAVAGICGCLVLVYLVAWLRFLDLYSPVSDCPAPDRCGGCAALGALVASMLPRSPKTAGPDGGESWTR